MKAGIIGTGFAAEVHMKALRSCGITVDTVMSQRRKGKSICRKVEDPTVDGYGRETDGSRRGCDPYLYPSGYPRKTGQTGIGSRKACFV